MQTAEVIEAPTLEPIIRLSIEYRTSLNRLYIRGGERASARARKATKHFATLLINHSFDELPDILKGLMTFNIARSRFLLTIFQRW